MKAGLARRLMATANDPNDDPLEAESLASLILRAYSAVRPTILTARKMEGLSLMEARLMRKIGDHPGRRLSEHVAELLLGASASEDLLKGLMAREFVRIGADGGLTLTQTGKDRFSAVISHARELEQAELADIAPADLKTAKKVLSQLIARHSRGDVPPGD